MIRVRYKDHLSPGLHGTAERIGRGTTVYLVPGLTGRQRSAALRRLRQEARRGCGPALPGADLTVALAADRCRVGLRNTAAVVRTHPAGSLLPMALAGLLMALFVLASVSARMSQLPPPPAPAGPIDAGAVTVIGYPQLAQTPWARPDSDAGELRAGVAEPRGSWSLAASSGAANAGHATSRPSAGGAAKTCGPPEDRAGVANRAPGTGQETACRPAALSPRLPWPPPPGGWPHFWPAERSAP